LTRILPPNVSEAQFDRALATWSAIVGEEHVVSSGADLASYRDPFAPGQAAFAASAALQPGSVEAIRAVLRVATQYRIPLWTVSTGRNFAYGGAAPRLTGSVVLDLQRMNRIIEVNETLAYALVEPGVSYFDLYA
jgi:4-cresol dehydrogenase (hydroxylating)